MQFNCRNQCTTSYMYMCTYVYVSHLLWYISCVGVNTGGCVCFRNDIELFVFLLLPGVPWSLVLREGYTTDGTLTTGQEVIWLDIIITGVITSVVMYVTYLSPVMGSTLRQVRRSFKTSTGAVRTNTLKIKQK